MERSTPPTGDLTQLSDELHRDAEALLEASGLMGRLELCGEVILTGSYRYELMTVPDLDLCLVSPRVGLELAAEIVHDLIAKGFWRGVSCDDFVQFPRDDLPSGVYLGLKRAFRGRFWKVDVWLLTDGGAGRGVWRSYDPTHCRAAGDHSADQALAT